ncbi:hypothetical protein MNBD_GAMMA04-1961 [hydrothermal vent metagenome]|uniref:Outer membrane protein domain-containing protein n=1 Tax=hydrothermal vent metagenome TaxID=652676 RepID=A0A3B0WUF2_9ZZZZ
MKKQLLSAMVFSVATVSLSASANSLENVGVGVSYGLFSGPTLEMSYPLSDSFSVRGALSSGMSLSQTDSGSGTEVDYTVDTKGGIHRLVLDYRPMGGNFFVSAGYAINNFEVTADADQNTLGQVTIGDQTYDGSANLSLNGVIDWDNAPLLTLGWGHSPEAGWGALFEIGAIFTGSGNVSLNGSGTVTSGGTIYDVSTDPTVRAALDSEEARIKSDIADYDFLPVLQAGITYRF